MQLFEEYGDQLYTSGDDGGRSAPTNLTCCQALLLPGIEADAVLDFDALVSYLAAGYLENTARYKDTYGEGRILAIP